MSIYDNLLSQLRDQSLHLKQEAQLLQPHFIAEGYYQTLLTKSYHHIITQVLKLVNLTFLMDVLSIVICILWYSNHELNQILAPFYQHIEANKHRLHFIRTMYTTLQ